MRVWLLASVAAFGWAGAAGATVTEQVTPSTTAPSGGLMSAFAGVTTITFNDGTASSQFLGGAVVQGSSAVGYAAPNGDTSSYFTIGTQPSYVGSASFTPGGTYNYFGFYWGSIDAYNTVTFYHAGTLVASVSGSMVSPANGNQTAASTNAYVDFLFSADSAYDKVVFSTTMPNFELDNVAYGNLVTSVPEPGSLALLALPVGLAGLIVSRRRRVLAAA